MRIWVSTFLMLLIHPVTAVATPSDCARNERIIREHYALLNSGEVERASDYFSDLTAHQGAGRSRAATLRVLKDIYSTFPDWRMEIVDIVCERDSVVVRSKVSGTHRGTGRLNVNGGLTANVHPTGKHFEVEHIHWYKMKDGKIAEHFATRDDVGMARQLGLLPTVPQSK